MNHLLRSALFALAGLACAAGAIAAPAPKPELLIKEARPLPWVPPCKLAKAVAEQLGRLAPELKPLPNETAFGVANGEIKVVVACGMTPDETYTYNRLLSNLGMELLAFKGEEPPHTVVQELAGRLKLSFRREGGSGAALVYLFPGEGPKKDGVRLTINAGGPPPGAARPAGSATSGPQGSEDLWDLYVLAKASDPELGRSRARFAGSRADTDAVRAGLLPHVGTSVGFNYLDQTSYNNPPPSQPTVPISLLGYNYTLNANVPILHVPTIYNVSAAAATARSDEAGVSVAGQNLIARLSDAYFGILKAKADEEIAREEISRVRQALEQAQAFLKAGTGDVIAVYEAQARLDSVIADESRAQSTLRLAEQKLSSIVGKPVSVVVDHLPREPRTPDPVDMQWWLTTMEERDPQIKQARESLAGTELQTRAAKAEHLPVIDATAGFALSKGNQYPPEVETHQWQVGGVLTVPLYSGGETSARVRRAKAIESERRYALDSVKEQRRENLKQAYFDLQYNVSLVRALEQKEASSQVQLNAVRKGRSIGTRTAIDLLNAEQQYSIAQRDLKNALYDNVVKMIQLRAAAGILSEEDLLAASGQKGR